MDKRLEQSILIKCPYEFHGYSTFHFVQGVVEVVQSKGNAEVFVGNNAFVKSLGLTIAARAG